MIDNPRTDIGWKHFVIRLIESLRWPAAWVVIVFILRHQIADLIDAVAHSFAR